MHLYKSASERIDNHLLKLLLSWCKLLDGYIKNNAQDCVRKFEILILSMCCGYVINNSNHTIIHREGCNLY